MENQTSIRLELGINAQRFIQQVQLNNKVIEDQIQKGIELALNDIVENDNFIEMIRESTKKELRDIVNKSVMSWEVRDKISKMVEAKIGEKIDQFADKIAEKVTASLS
jgi:polyribonucleotide nucleotidyltransferase